MFSALFFNCSIFLPSKEDNMAKANKNDRFNDTFPTRLRQLVKEKGVTQAELASLLGISRQSFSAYCDGNTQPNIENTVKMAEYFGVSVDYLFGLSDIRATDPATRSLCETLKLPDEAINAIQNNEAVREVIRFLIEQHQLASDRSKKPNYPDGRLFQEHSLISNLHHFLTICNMTTDVSLTLYANGCITADICDENKTQFLTLVPGSDERAAEGEDISVFQYSAKQIIDYIADIMNSYMGFKYSQNIFSKELELVKSGHHNKENEES